MAVWEDQLLPLMTWKDAARMGGVCKVVRKFVREHFAGCLGHRVVLEELRAAMTTFPRLQNLSLSAFGSDGLCKEALLQWLREGNRWRYLKHLRGGYLEEVTSDFQYMALREGALPSLKSLDLDLQHGTGRAALTEGLLGAMHELRMAVGIYEDEVGLMKPQLEALALVRQLPTLIQLEVLGRWQRSCAVAAFHPTLPQGILPNLVRQQP
jgi:hypothetical protein